MKKPEAVTVPDAPVMATTYVPGVVGDALVWCDPKVISLHPVTAVERIAKRNQSPKNDCRRRRRGAPKIAMPARIAPLVARSSFRPPPRDAAVGGGAVVVIVRIAVCDELPVRVAGFPELKFNTGSSDAFGGVETMPAASETVPAKFPTGVMVIMAVFPVLEPRITLTGVARMVNPGLGLTATIIGAETNGT